MTSRILWVCLVFKCKLTLHLYQGAMLFFRNKLFKFGKNCYIKTGYFRDLQSWTKYNKKYLENQKAEARSSKIKHFGINDFLFLPKKRKTKATRITIAEIIHRKEITVFKNHFQSLNLKSLKP